MTDGNAIPAGIEPGKSPRKADAFPPERYDREATAGWSNGPLLTTCFLLAAVLGVAVLAPDGLFSWSIRRLAAQEAEESGGGVALPTDRLRERQFDQANRLIEAKRFADAATLLDEMLAAAEDVFLEEGLSRGQTSRSMKTRATELIGSLPAAGREAYLLQFRSRAERALAAGIEANDDAQIVAVARRWFHTPAGRRAAITVAATLLEAGQPLAAAAWLDRLADNRLADLPESVRTAVELMRTATSLATTGVPAGLAQQPPPLPAAVQLGGERLQLGSVLDRRLLTQRLVTAVQGVANLPPEDARNWQMERGSPGRNPVCRCDRPLLVPRYRVPLTLHPEESRLVGIRRQLLRDQGLPILPAGGPLAVDGLLLSQSRAGLVAVDFKTGKRVWMQGRLAESALVDTDDRQSPEELPHPLDLLFTDATAATLASDGQRVFAVESPPDLGPSRAARNRLRRLNRPAPTLSAGNRLVAYDIASGEQRWQLPGEDEEETTGRWYLGSPLPIGGELYVLVEARQQIRLDVLAADSGETLWSQPLADVDLDYDIENRGDRRQAGLSPAFAGGVLVCPTGAGAVIAVDLAARTLRWAYRFAVPKPADVRRLANGIRLRMRVLAGGLGGVRIQANADGDQPPTRWLDAVPTIAGDRVLLTPLGSEDLHCVDLRTGESLWMRSRNEHLFVAGVTDRNVILVGQQQVTAVSLDDAQECWEQPLQFPDQQVCGRPLITGSRLFVPLTTPAVAEIDLATGRLVGSSPGRGENLPGNLVAHRGEIISQGIDSLDVFHQTVPLERAIETATAANPGDPWAIGWRGELRLAAGETAAGLDDIRRAYGAAGLRPAPAIVSRAIRSALRHDFAAASASWQEGAAAAESTAAAGDILRQAAAGFLAADDAVNAWKVCQQMLVLPAAGQGDVASAPLIADPQDSRLMLSADRWLRRQLERLAETATTVAAAGDGTAAVPDQITAAAAAAGAAAAAINQLPERVAALELVVERFGDHPAIGPARQQLAAALRQQETAAVGLARQNLQLKLDLLALRQRQPGEVASPSAAATTVAAAWPVGEVTVNDDQQPDDAEVLRNRIPVPLTHTADSAFPESSLETDGTNLLLKDRFGRPIGGGIPLSGGAGGAAWGQQISRITRSQASQATMMGRFLLLTTTAELAVFEVSKSGDGDHRLLWIASNPYAEAVQPQRVPQGEPLHERLLRQLGPRPLGMEQEQPHRRQVQRTPFFRTGQPRLTGVPVIYDRTLELRDLLTGRILWQRRQLPDRAEAFGDDEVLCVAGPDGKDSLLLSMADGHLLARHDLPTRDERLAVAGRRLLILEAGEETANPDERSLVSLDVLDLNRTAAGSCGATARGFADPAGVFFTVATDGRLTAIDVAAGRTIFASELSEPPAGLTQLRVLPWEDRYLILVGRAETPAEQARFEGIRSIGRFGVNRFGGLVETSLLYAVDRLSGDMLWTRPASIQRHILHLGQPAGLPVLIFARQLHMNRNSRQVPDQPRHSLLCLDKRTGGLLHADDRILIEPRHAAATAELRVVGEPATGSVRLRVESRQRGGAGTREIVLQFTGLPTDRPQPFRAEDKPLVYTDILSELKYWIERALLFPN